MIRNGVHGEPVFCASSRGTDPLKEITDLNKILAEAPQSPSPLICVGQWVSAASIGSGKIDIESIFVTQAGHVVVILSRKPDSEAIPAIIKEFRSWTYDTLDRIAADYSYNAFQQAFSVCDLLAKHGQIVFSQESGLKERITSCMKAGAFSLFCFEEPGYQRCNLH